MHHHLTEDELRLHVWLEPLPELCPALFFTVKGSLHTVDDLLGSGMVEQLGNEGTGSHIDEVRLAS
jgi:hypothetical protein